VSSGSIEDIGLLFGITTRFVEGSQVVFDSLSERLIGSTDCSKLRRIYWKN
jgi:hypothetical protein